MKRYDAIVIGAGLSGIAAAIRLAHFNRRTALIERHSRIGGLNSIYERGGYQFDVGLHALTNYNPAGPKSAPLKKLARALRIDLDAFNLRPQTKSVTTSPNARLEFDNDIETLIESIRISFPTQVDNFRRLIVDVLEFDDSFARHKSFQSSIARIESFISERALVDLLMAPIFYYGSPTESDIDYIDFVTLFKSLYLEGFARPTGGMRTILDLLSARMERSGVELALKSRVSSIILENRRAKGVRLANGDEIFADLVLSSVGAPESELLIGDERAITGRTIRAGRLSFIETIYVLDKPTGELGVDEAIIFYNRRADRLDYKDPAALWDLMSGVLCYSGSFEYRSELDERRAEKRIARITNIASHDIWDALGRVEYKNRKKEKEKLSEKIFREFSVDISDHIECVDTFTPKTIRKFTNRLGGAVYGSIDKVRSGRTRIDGLYLIGTDHGYLGIVGSMLSGVLIANEVLR